LQYVFRRHAKKNYHLGNSHQAKCKNLQFVIAKKEKEILLTIVRAKVCLPDRNFCDTKKEEQYRLSL
jgi:hypothetical protein